ncbi:MAG: penicillin-binding protein [Acidobacteria bacterium]|nr:MAG: penicillin-binding protein [Acidobacteriota bacterium]
MPERPAQFKVHPDPSRPRTSLVVTVLIIWMLIIGGQLVRLQVGQYDVLSARARRQQQQTVETTAPRGLILDRAGRELARSLEVDSFFVVPSELTDVHDAATRLALVLDLKAPELEARLRSAQDAKRKFLWLARQLDADKAERVRALQLAGVHTQKETKRYYPNGSLAAHVLGFVGTDDAGLAGIERMRDAALKGDGGAVRLDGDGLRRAYDSHEQAAQAGRSIVLTIDQNVQYQAEQALGAAMEQTHAKSATAIVLDPHTGEILALANAPTFDPNDARRVGAQAGDSEHAAQDVKRNPALENIYEPGSTFKIVAFSAALEEKLARPEELIDCQMGSITVFGRVVHDSHPHGTLTVSDALAMSSNVAAIKLGIRVGSARLYDYIRRFGFGAKTGVELPGETKGLLRDVKRWQPTSIGSIPMGQEIGVTAVQMAAAFGAIANDGVRMQPHLIREVREADSTTVEQAQPEAHRVISAETAAKLKPMLESVTVKGTAKRAQLDGYTTAGKTGTAQKIDPRTHTYSHTKFVASFVGFAPVENPAVVIAVVIDEPAGAYYGGEVAAPVFQQIATNVLPYLNVEPDAEPDQQPAHREQLAEVAPELQHARAVEQAQMNDAQQALLPEVAERNGGEVREVVYAPAGERALLMPDLRGQSVRDAARVCAQLGLELEARGEGRAWQQSPEPGARIESGQVVRIDFGRSD